jgi:hypothetical protein
MRESARALLETLAYMLFPFVYSMFVVFLGVYFNAALGGSGNLVIVGAIAPVVAAWIIVLRRRESRNAEAQTQGFQTSPEKHAEALDDYLQLLENDKKKADK